MSRAMWPKLPSAPYCYCLEGLLFRLLELRWPLFRALDLQITAPLVHHGETTRTVPVTRFYPETPEFAIICRCVCKSMPLYGFARIFLKCRFVLQDFPCLLWNALGHNSVNARGTYLFYQETTLLVARLSSRTRDRICYFCGCKIFWLHGCHFAWLFYNTGCGLAGVLAPVFALVPWILKQFSNFKIPVNKESKFFLLEKIKNCIKVDEN